MKYDLPGNSTRINKISRSSKCIS